MKRHHKIKPTFVIDNISDLGQDKMIQKRIEEGKLAAAPLRLIIPGLSSLRTVPIKHATGGE